MLKSIEGMQTNRKVIEYLSDWYPCLYIYILKKRSMDLELSKYMNTCKQYENDRDATKYSKYVHGYWIPYLQ